MSNTLPPSPSAIDIQALLVEFDSSGLNAAAFARSKSLPTWKLYNALRRRSGKVRSLRAAARGERNALLPVHVVDAPSVLPVAAMELVLAGGHRLLIGPGFDAPTLQRLVGALAQC